MNRIPAFDAEIFLGYFDEIVAAIRAYLDSTSEVELDQSSIGFDGKQTNYYWIRHPLFDMTSHVGEMLAIKAMWDRHQGA